MVAHFTCKVEHFVHGKPSIYEEQISNVATVGFHLIVNVQRRSFVDNTSTLRYLRLSFCWKDRFTQQKVAIIHRYSLLNMSGGIFFLLAQ